MRWIGIILLFTAQMAFGQTEGPSASENSALDSAAIADLDTIVERRNGMIDLFEGNPGKALFRGLMIPAGGQIYNKRWWKVPLALGIEAGTVGYLIYTYDLYDTWNKEYISVVIDKNDPNPELNQPNPDRIIRNRNSLRSDREMAWIFFAVGHLFTAFEAYIDRHLLEFDVSDDLTFKSELSNFGPMACLGYAIPLSTSKYKTVPPIEVFP